MFNLVKKIEKCKLKSLSSHTSCAGENCLISDAGEEGTKLQGCIWIGTTSLQTILVTPGKTEQAHALHPSIPPLV